MLQVIRNKLLEKKMFIIIFILTILTSFFVTPRFAAIDFKVLASLFNLMLIALAFEKYNFLDYVAIKILDHCSSERQLGLTIILLTALLSMILTNDVALITMVPITLLIGKRLGKAPFVLVALETVAANIGSSLTPFGNPQNLFLYAFYKIPTGHFLLIMTPFVLGGLVFLILLTFKLNKAKLSLHVDPTPIKEPKKVIVYTLSLVLTILSILRLLPYQIITLFIILVFFVNDRNLFVKVDYYLLGTFVGFFLFIDNLSHMPFFSEWLLKLDFSHATVFLTASLLSQIISNVPSAIFLSSFTEAYTPLLLGVSVGGMGTLIASMANLIAFKLYVKQYEGKQYLIYFYKINVIGFVLFSVIFTLYFLIGGH